ncbi:hypothetical protein [Cloacibacterium normanense]|uniref:TonB C-terminal domain-containing protein n=1 Tax=Cloacibacterium normanense TaxID=237258 RepID=A0A1E5UFY4_9FLAO|nr:hypothetical protein [Cloacibacterium normanense]AZI70368.1 hypothetical protein EB819_10960 [Cloacibacterium normanense]OEL11792.1 hypothetical protein BHF72_1733 [Cloacibacterium normanense]SDO89086.1 hypothetical protein SAMN04489756_12614 [Cloacibacterium normanense]
MKTISVTIFLVIFSFGFSQQNDEFKRVKMYFDSQKQLINTEFQKKYNSETNLFVKENLKKDYNYFIQKIDSVRNVAYLGALIRVKNNEGLKNINAKNEEIEFQNVQTPEFPNGIDALREKVASLFYSKGIEYCKNELNTTVSFVVDENGSITDIKAEGENISFNKQAEIAMYLISEKFTKPALQKGNAVKYAFRMPLSIKFE